jgi:hypothetical protein
VVIRVVSKPPHQRFANQVALLKPDRDRPLPRAATHKSFKRLCRGKQYFAPRDTFCRPNASKKRTKSARGLAGGVTTHLVKLVRAGVVLLGALDVDQDSRQRPDRVLVATHHEVREPHIVVRGDLARSDPRARKRLQQCKAAACCRQCTRD